MKTRILFLLATVLTFAAEVQAQCPIPCDKEAFPYYFCDHLGNRHTKCSTDPQSDTANGWKPVLTHIPGCVNVTPINPSMDYQPNTTPPQPGPWLGWDYFDPPSIDDEPYATEAEGSETQYILDSELFEEGQPPVEPPASDPSYFTVTTNPGDAPDSTDYTTIENPDDHIGDYAVTPYDYDPYPPQDNPDYTTDSTTYADEMSEYDSAYYAWKTTLDVQLYYRYLGGEAQYQADLNAWVKNQNSYTQVWSDAQADSDAKDGLNSWLALCHLHGDPNCCIYIEPDDTLQNWPGNYDAAAGSAHFPIGYTHGSGTFCSDGTSCPDHNYRYISYNTTNAFFYKNNGNNDLHDPAYILHPSPFEGFYTGTVTPSGSVYTNYSDYSFREMVEHEIGHFLGMRHPEQKADDSSTCVNNQTQCPNSLDHHMLMSDEGIGVDNPPFGIQPDDACMFQKLYCPGTGEDGVSQQQQVPEPPSPEIFPNPTTGACQLQYELLDRTFVQVAIYDMLGNQMRLVSSDYEVPGTRTISLGTESLPSGHYVCRVRVGENVTYINVVVER